MKQFIYLELLKINADVAHSYKFEQYPDRRFGRTLQMYVASLRRGSNAKFGAYVNPYAVQRKVTIDNRGVSLPEAGYYPINLTLSTCAGVHMEAGEFASINTTLRQRKARVKELRDQLREARKIEAEAAYWAKFNTPAKEYNNICMERAERDAWQEVLGKLSAFEVAMRGKLSAVDFKRWMSTRYALTGRVQVDNDLRTRGLKVYSFKLVKVSLMSQLVTRNAQLKLHASVREALRSFGRGYVAPVVKSGKYIDKFENYLSCDKTRVTTWGADGVSIEVEAYWAGREQNSDFCEDTLRKHGLPGFGERDGSLDVVNRETQKYDALWELALQAPKLKFLEKYRAFWNEAKPEECQSQGMHVHIAWAYGEDAGYGFAKWVKETHKADFDLMFPWRANNSYARWDWVGRRDEKYAAIRFHRQYDTVEFRIGGFLKDFDAVVQYVKYLNGLKAEYVKLNNLVAVKELA